MNSTSSVFPPSTQIWPIVVCMHGIAPVTRAGVPLQDASTEAWSAMFGLVSGLGFEALEVSDTHFRLPDMTPSRRRELAGVARENGVELASVHVQRQSVIEPEHGLENLAYAHRAIDAAAEQGTRMFSTGLHRPLTRAQREATWFWNVPGSADPKDPATWNLAVQRLRELGAHAASVGLEVSLEMYEDTYLGNAESAARLVEEIGLENVGLNPDIGNLVRLPRPIDDWHEMYARVLPYANYWHMKNYTRDSAADGSWYTTSPTTLALGAINYRAMVELAIGVGFRGPFVMEHYGGDSLGISSLNRDYVASLLRHSLERGRTCSWDSTTWDAGDEAGDF